DAVPTAGRSGRSRCGSVSSSEEPQPTYAELLETRCKLTQELERLNRDRGLAVAVVHETLLAHKRLDVDAAAGIRRWHGALRQLEEVLYDLEQRAPHDGHPI